MDDWRTAFFIAYKTVVRGNKSMLVLMVFILTLSFFNMMFISGVLSGIWDSELHAILTIVTSDIIISPEQQPEVKQFIQGASGLQAKIQTIPGVIASVRHYSLAGSVTFDKQHDGQYKSVSGVILGIDPAKEQSVLTPLNLMLAGQTLSPDDTDQVVLSSAVAGGYGGIQRQASLGGARVGDKVTITYSNGVQRTYTVKGIYNDVLAINESFVTAKEAESVLGVSDSASSILVKVDQNTDSLASYQSRIQGMAPLLDVENYNDFLGSYASFEAALDLIGIIVSVISVVVAAITIFVLIYVNAVNKRRQIGILKAIGINQSIIVNAYILQSLFYTFFGLITGDVLVFGILNPLLLAHPVALIPGAINLELSFTSTRVIISILAFIVAGYLAGRIPARIVAREDILTAIWG